MNPWWILLKNDARLIQREPMLLVLFFAPILLGVFLRYGIPWIQASLSMYVDISPYYDIILGCDLLLIPILIGTAMGLILLDERDELLLAYIRVTPVSMKGLLLFRSVCMILYCLLMNGLLLLWVHWIEWDIWQSLTLLILSSLEAPLIALALAGFAANKVEGLALSKGLSFIMLVPILLFFLSHPWDYFAGFLPIFWGVKPIFYPESGFVMILLHFIIGLVLHGLVGYGLYKRLETRSD